MKGQKAKWKNQDIGWLFIPDSLLQGRKECHKKINSHHAEQQDPGPPEKQ